MNPLDTKKRLFSEMAQSAKSGMLSDLRSRYGPKPPAEAAPEAPPDEGLSDEELEPLLSITLEVKKGGDKEPDASDANEADENEPDMMG